jgi:acetaldehyde dehydrogenase
MAISAAIVGTGNIGTDLMAKLLRSTSIELRYLVGVDPDSDGLRRGRAAGLEVSHEGVDWLLARPESPEVVFEATSASAHLANAPKYEAAGIQAIDLTPAAIGPFVVPAINLPDHFDAPNLNMITCGGQATIPMVAAVSRVAAVDYAEVVVSIASRSAGPGTRANIDEFTDTTARGLEIVGGAARGKAIIILNPAEPPLMMRDTVFCSVGADADSTAITASVAAMAEQVRQFVPGYRMKAEPQFDDARPEWGGRARVAIFLEVEGQGDYLPPYAGNLDIMTAAAAWVGDELAAAKIGASR